MEQKRKIELTDRDCQFLSKFRELIKDSDGVSYYGWMDALTSLVYRIQKTSLFAELTEGKCREYIYSRIDDIEEDVANVCEIIFAGVKIQMDELLSEDAKKEPNTNI